MLAYAANRLVTIDRRPHPNAMLLIIGIHVAVIAAVMSAKMEIQHHRVDRTTVISIPLPPDPPPLVSDQKRPQRPTQSLVDHQQTSRTLDNRPAIDFDGGRIEGKIGDANGLSTHDVSLPPIVQSVKSGPRLLTSGSELKPPYPPSKLLNEEEATLTLKLTIDPGGRVVAVDPVGRADTTFLDAARKYLIAHWRYEPASEDGHAAGSTTIINLRFELNG
jgi:protein TonB